MGPAARILLNNPEEEGKLYKEAFKQYPNILQAFPDAVLECVPGEGLFVYVGFSQHTDPAELKLLLIQLGVGILKCGKLKGEVDVGIRDTIRHFGQDFAVQQQCRNTIA